MRVFTTHWKPGEPPLVVREGFSWLAAFFGWIWLLLHRAWIAAFLVFTLGVLAVRLTRGIPPIVPSLGVFLLQGWFGRDLWRWSLHRRGYMEGPVVAAHDEDSALARVITERPELARV